MLKVPTVLKFLLTISAVALAALGLTPVVQAQGADEEIEEIIVSGFRGKPRTAVDSAVPIDTFDTDMIEAVAHTDTVDILQTLVPSFNVGRQPISDGASFIRPATLRNLPSHHTLVLINGKRRHRAALVSIGGSGTQGPDVATIPSFAIQSIEVLRDGASSQYGSDAIAGVINFNLKDNSEGFALGLSTGEYFEGDGSGFTISGNVGLPLGENGFLSISGEIDEQDFSERAHQYCEGWFCVDQSNPIFSDQSAVRQGYVTGTPTAGLSAYEQGLQVAFPSGVSAASVAGQNVMPWGQPNVESVRVFYNAGIELNNGVELYSFGNYSNSTGDGSFFYRWPENGTIELLRRADGSMYSPLEKFTGGFTPRFEGEIDDIGIAGGFRGETDGGFSYDASVRYGSNEIDYRLFNTVNPSYGPDTPTDFKPGVLSNEEFQVQLDLANEIDIGTDSPLIFAYGLSYMDETYDV
ncbi:MAG: TonB-dependent receptor plug domain-containing protein, partial [bacterium]|nr:TonB-dependent receptor plug domain-containing protein [bacterium]